MNIALKNIRHLLVIALTAYCFLLSTAFASGVVHVKIGENLQLQPSNVSGNLEYSWVLKQGEEIIPQGKSGVTSSSASSFQHVFTEPGEYEVRLLISDPESGATESTTTIVKADITSPNFENKQVTFTTLPPLNSEGILVVDPASPEVTFFPGGASGNPSEYWIDTDINEDADGDGITDNDIENKSHSSFYTGQAWSHVYDPSKSERTAQVTVKYPTGETVSKTIDIMLDAQGAQNKLPLRAVLETLPRANDDGFIYLPGNEGNVTFFAGNSEGTIVEYRMDKNVLFDTNGDGNPENDIDNREHASFVTGSSWTTNFKKEWGDTVVELLVVNDQNKGSKVQRKIVFDDALAMQQGDSGVEATLPQKLITSQQEIFAGESVDFIALGFAEGAQITWDFDGDGVAEYEGIRTHNTYQYQNDGVFPVNITAQKDGEPLGALEKSITVKPVQEREIMTSSPTAKFSFSVSDNTVSFQDTSFADSRLINTDLSYSWDLGDGSASAEANPEHVFAQIGSYTVVLTVTDAVGRSTTTAENITIGSIAPGSVAQDPQNGDDNGDDQDSGENTDTQDSDDADGEDVASKGIGWIWWTVILILGIPLILVVTYLVFRKIQYPDLSFEEIVSNDLDQIRHRKHEEITQVTAGSVPVETPAMPDDQQTAQSKEPVVEVVAEEPAPAPAPVIEDTVEQNVEPSVADESEPPAWLKKEEEVVTEETPSEKVAEKADAPEEPKPPEGAVPDWLKEAQAAETPAQETQASEDVSVEVGQEKKEVPENAPDAGEASVPDWMKESAPAPEESAPEEPAAPEVPEESVENPVVDKAPKPEASPPEQKDQSSEAPEEDLPDWMK